VDAAFAAAVVSGGSVLRLGRSLPSCQALSRVRSATACHSSRSLTAPAVRPAGASFPAAARSLIRAAAEKSCLGRWFKTEAAKFLNAKRCVMQISVPLSRLCPSRRNPRWVKPEREAHRRLVASIRAFGLLEPLVVRPAEGEAKNYQVIAGNRRLSALRQIHREDKQDPKIPCEMRKVDDATADALSLSENFAREAMHPLDEAEAFATLASDEAKGVESIAAEFGVSDRYVKQRMKLASLAELVKSAYRQGQIDTATAEAFAAVPQERQVAIWQELNGSPHNAEQVRGIIAAAWIDASNALFDISVIPESAVSRDLFSERVLVERTAFMEAQGQALAAERQRLVEEGWGQAVVGSWDEVRDRLLSTDKAEHELDERTTQKLKRIESRRQKMEAKLDKIDEGDEAALSAVGEQVEALERLARQIAEDAPQRFAEATKAVGIVFLILDPEGKVRREFRVAKRSPHSGVNGNGQGGGESASGTQPPTSDDLSDRQLAATFTHQTLAVREALLNNNRARMRVLALILHEKVRSDGLAIRHEANAVTLQTTRGDGFTSPVAERLKEQRAALDPIADSRFIEDHQAYARLSELSDAKIADFIDLLIVEAVTAHLQRRTELVHRLGAELKVDIRQSWRPDAAWLGSYQKIQLAHLLGELLGPTYAPANENRKKSELVEVLAKLFSDAAEGTFEDKKLAGRVNRWLPTNLREVAGSNG